jgi:tetratricopeptide (TPR) repeat protein
MKQSTPEQKHVKPSTRFGGQIHSGKEKIMTHAPHITLNDLCLLLHAGQAEQVLALLAEARTLRPAEQTYVRARAALRQEEWETLAACLLEAGAPGRDDYRAKTAGMTIRRRRSWLLWLLGNLAREIGQDEDAFGFYTRCLRHLDERRMNDPWLRARALCGRGAALLRMRSPQAALAEYEQAHELCQNTHLPDQLEIVMGLSEASLALDHLKEALAYGQQALQMVTDSQQERSLRFLLGTLYARQGEQAAAQSFYLEALGLAERGEPDPNQIVTILLALADLQCREGHTIEARTSCEQALLYQEQCQASTRGALYLACGKLAQAEALSEEALGWYTKAAQQFSEAGQGAELAEAHRLLAQMCEDSGDLDEAASHWKAAYQAHAGSDSLVV